MKITIVIDVYPEDHNIDLVEDRLNISLKPFVDYYHTKADVKIEQGDVKYIIEGAWNG